jgi:hypothetical protein
MTNVARKIANKRYNEIHATSRHISNHGLKPGRRKAKRKNNRAALRKEARLAMKDEAAE